MNTIDEIATTIKKTSTTRSNSVSSLIIPSKRSASIALASSTRSHYNAKKLFNSNKNSSSSSSSSNNKNKFDLRTYTDIVKLNNDGVNSLERKNYVEALRMFRKAYDHVMSKVTVDNKKANNNTSIAHNNKRRKIHKNKKNNKKTSSTTSKVVSAMSISLLSSDINDVDHTKENNFNMLIHNKVLHCYETNNMDYFIDMRKKRRYHYHFDSSSGGNSHESMFRRRSSSSRNNYYFNHNSNHYDSTYDDDNTDVHAIINMNDTMNNSISQQCNNNHNNNSNGQQNQQHKHHQLVHTSYITDVEKEFHIFNHGLRINQPTATNGTNSTANACNVIVLPSSIEELNKLLSLLLYNIGKVFQHANQLDDALEIYRKSISLVSTTKTTPTEDNDLDIISISDIVDEDNNTHDTSTLNETTTKLAILHSMGQIYFIQSKTDDSIDAYKTAKSIIDYKLQQKQKNNTIMSLLSSTTINCINVLKKYQEFVISPDDALTATLQANIDNSNKENVDGDGDDESSTTNDNDDSKNILNQYKQVALFYTNIAIEKYSKGKYNASITNFTTALTIYSNIFGADSLDVGIILFYLGQVYYIKNELDVAIRYFVQHFDIAKKNKKLLLQHNNNSLEDNECTTNINLDIASVCCYLGKVFHKKQQLEYALIYYEAALGIYQKIFGESSLQVACLLNKVGFIYYDNDLYDLALKCCKSQWAMEKKFYMSTNSQTETTTLSIKSKSENNYKNIIITLLNIADIHLKKFQYASSLEFYRKVLGLQKKMYIDTKDHPEIIETMNRIGYVLYLKGDYNKCFKIFLDSLRIHFHQKRNHPFDSIIIAFKDQIPSPIATKTMYDIGKTLFTIGDLDTALSCFNLSLNMNLSLLSSQENNNEITTTTPITTAITTTTPSVLSYAVIDQFDVLITLYDVARIHHHKGDVNAALETLIMLTNIYNNDNNHNKNNKKDNVIILIRALSFAANIYCLYHNNDQSKKTKMMECYVKAVRLCRKYNISEYDDSILLPLDVKIYSINIDYPLAAPVA